MKPVRYLVCYDVADPLRLGRIYRLVSEEAALVQYSVYLYEGTTCSVQALAREISSLIDPKEDDIRVYALPPCPRVIRLGRMFGQGAAFLPGDRSGLLGPQGISDGERLCSASGKREE